MRTWLLLSTTIAAAAIAAAACGVGSDCDFGFCAGPPATSDGSSGNDGDGAPPPGCDASADPKDSLPCVVSAYGVFVSMTGKPDAAGTKEDPVSSVAAALSKLGPKHRIYICEGTYPERVVLKSPVSLYGGFSCTNNDWKYSGNRASLGTPLDTGFALDAQGVTGTFEIVDLEFRAGDGNDAFVNSVAARFTRTASASLRRVRLAAGKGAGGKVGDIGLTGDTVNHTDLGGTTIDPAGKQADVSGPGGAKICKCANDSTDNTTGGGGGAPNGQGSDGSPPSIPASGLNQDGKGGPANAADCTAGIGHTGATPLPATGGSVPLRLGALTNDNWTPESGGSGAIGIPGQGGGGGSGQAGGGGGGGCGGCGGFGGQGGSGGGASIALLAIDSPVRLVGAELTAGTGGRGGDGGNGGSAGAGGIGANGFGGGCPGGRGGKGAAGGGGAGGAGGISVGILFSGPQPDTDGSTITPGTPGGGGTGKSSNDGPSGVKAQTAAADALRDGG